MIGLIFGQVASNYDGQVVVKTAGGGGYLVYGSLAGLKEWTVGKEVSILTYLAVRENALDLYGFVSEQERELFKHLLNVSGIGPKSALHILSLGTVQEIKNAIINGDIDYLTKVNGVGKRTAERIVVELKTKIGDSDLTVGENKNGENLSDVIDGLVTMGYSAQQAREAIKKINTDGKSSEQLLRE